MDTERTPTGLTVTQQDVRVFSPKLAQKRQIQSARPSQRHSIRVYGSYGDSLTQLAFLLGLPLLVTTTILVNLPRWLPDASQDTYIILILVLSIAALAGGVMAASWLGEQKKAEPAPHRKPCHLRLDQHQATSRDEDTTQMPLEAITAARASGDSVLIEVNGGQLRFFEDLTSRQARWMADLIAERSQQARAALKTAGVDPDKAARSPAELRKLLQK